MKRPLSHVAAEVFDTPIAILPDKLETILRAVGPRLVPDAASLQQLIDAGILSSPKSRKNCAWDDGDEEDSEYDSRSSDKLYTLTNSGIAIIPISGTLMESGGWMSSLSGCSSYDGIRKATIKAMDEDGAVRAVLYKVNSPGGSTHGCFELTDLIHSYRGKKPIWSIAKHQACSAAYALSSSADRVFLTMTAGVGSVGVFCLHCDVESADEKMGVKYTYIHYGDKKVEGNPHEKLSKSARSDMQAEVDRQGDLFVDRIARNRNISRQSVIDTQAGVLFAASSIPLFADEVATFDQVIEKLSGKLDSRNGRLPVGSRGDSPSLDKEAGMASTAELKAKRDARDAKKAELLASETELAALEASASSPAPTPIPSVRADSDPPPGPPDGGDDKKEKEDPPPPDPDGKKSGKGDKSEKADKPDDCDMDDDAKKKAAKLAASTVPLPAKEKKMSESTLKLSAEDMYEINYLGSISGFPELAAKAIADQTPLADFRKLVQDQRSSASKSPVDSSHTGSASASGMDAILQQATILATNSGGKLNRAQAIEQICAANPQLYSDYEDERGAAINAARIDPKIRREYGAKLTARLSQLRLSGDVGKFDAVSRAV